MMDSLFDTAMADADSAIIDVLGTGAVLMICGKLKPVRGDFYDPQISSHLPGMTGVISDSLPTLFVKSADIVGLRERDQAIINGRDYWVFRVGADDSGSRHISLKEGKPPADSRYQRK
jgi:hypothetical protein